jgi:hypothetical protein
MKQLALNVIRIQGKSAYNPGNPLTSAESLTKTQIPKKSPVFFTRYLFAQHVNTTCSGDLMLSVDLFHILYLLNLQRREILFKKGGC